MKIIFSTLLFSLGISFIVYCSPPKSIKADSSPPAAEAPLPAKVVFSPLTWKPNIPVEDIDMEPLNAYRQISISLSSLEDNRVDPRSIGKTLEDKKIPDQYIPLVTKTAVNRWCRAGIHKALDDMQLTVDDKKGVLRLDMELIHIELDDNITQKGSIEFRVTANTDQDLLIWEGNIRGSSDLYYRPKDSDGISECLSNTLKVTLNNLFCDQSFRDAVIKTFELEQ